MRKIPTLFRRDPEDMRRVLPEVNPTCQWVLDGEGVATRKYDGTCVLLDEDGLWWARREIKPGKTPPPGYRAEETDEDTGKTVGWEPMEQSPFAKFHTESVFNVKRDGYSLAPGTYELVGPKINGNPEGEAEHWLVFHGADPHPEPLDLTFDGLRRRLLELHAAGIEGIVWHHPDGRMAKLKGRDFPTDVCRETGDPIGMRCVIEDGRHMHFPPGGSDA